MKDQNSEEEDEDCGTIFTKNQTVEDNRAEFDDMPDEARINLNKENMLSIQKIKENAHENQLNTDIIDNQTSNIITISSGEQKLLKT